jgi:uncharacterized protein YejL (UPF0352 family)
MKLEALVNDVVDYLEKHPQPHTLKEIQLAFCTTDPKLMTTIVGALVTGNVVQVSLRGE